jgi:ATP/maltotriose-dependent transcriptional regulator MalT
LAFSRGNRSLGAVERRREPEGLCFSLTRPERRAERSRLTSLIQGSSNLTARVICAPVGAGKTAALQHYVGRTNGCYLNVRGLLARSAGDAGGVFDNLPAYADEIVLDDLDAAPPDAVDAFFDRIAAGTDRRRYILAGRSRQRMRVSRLLALGRASIIDGAALAFNRDEAAQLADRHGLRYDEEDLAQLLHDTDGWPIAVHWIMRDAPRRLRNAITTSAKRASPASSEARIAGHFKRG